MRQISCARKNPFTTWQIPKACLLVSPFDINKTFVKIIAFNEQIMDQQHTPTHSASLLSLPTEVHHIIFDYIDTRTLVQSVPYICKTFYKCVKNYNRFKLDCCSSSEFDIRMASRIMHPENIVSLTISDRLERLFYIHLDSVFDINQFAGLKFLTLRQINDLGSFLPLLNNNKNHLISLLIEFCQRPSNESLEILSNVINCFNIKYLNLSNIDNITEHITWPSQCRLARLCIGTCTFTEYQLILRQSPYLKALSLQNCMMNSENETISTSLSSELVSLSILSCKLPIEQLNLILSLTPALTYLKVMSSTSIFNTYFNGCTWEEIITSKLSHLNKFEFLFTSNPGYMYNYTNTLESIIVTFQTPFWLEDKHWFITCDLLIQQKILRLFTKPICIADLGDLLRLEVSSMNSVYRLTKRSPTLVIDFNEDQDITKIDLSNVKLNPLGLKSVANALAHNQEIHVSNHRNQYIRESVFDILAIESKNPENIPILHLAGKDINKNELKCLADELQDDKTIAELSLGYNCIDENDVQYMADLLKINTTLTTLSLVGNHIGELGAQYLADALRINKVLTALYLEGNQIGDVGTEYLAGALQTNKTLTTLSLPGNRIGTLGVRHLADALRVNTSLTTLSLIANRFGMEAGALLVNALENNKSLTMLSIELNQVSDQIIRHINELLKQNAQIPMNN